MSLAVRCWQLVSELSPSQALCLPLETVDAGGGLLAEVVAVRRGQAPDELNQTTRDWHSRLPRA